MSEVVWLATVDGALCVRAGQVTQVGLAGKSLNLIVAQPDELNVVHAGARADGVYRSTDDGATWTRVLAADVWTLCQRPERCELLYAGVEPAGVYRSSDFGRTWVELDAIYALPAYAQWWFPPPPHRAHVTAFVMHPHAVKVIYAGIEVGGVIVSHNGGRTWSELRGGIHADVHSLTCGAAPFTLYAATQQGVYRSVDDGDTWQRLGVGYGLDKRYSYAITRITGEAERLLLVASTDSTARDSVLFRSDDGGVRWLKSMHGLPMGEMAGRMKIAAHPTQAGVCYVSLPTGSLFRSADAGASWRLVAANLPDVNGITVY